MKAPGFLATPADFFLPVEDPRRGVQSPRAKRDACLSAGCGVEKEILVFVCDDDNVRQHMDDHSNAFGSFLCQARA